MRDFILPPPGGFSEFASALAVNGCLVQIPETIVNELDREPIPDFDPPLDRLHEVLTEKLISIPNQAGTFPGSRPLRHGAPGKRIVYFQSRKCGGAVPCESRLEAAFCLELEAHSDVDRYRGQPLTLIGTDSWYTPDFAVRFHDGRIVLFEVKPGGRLTDAALQKRLLRIQRWCAAARIGFQVVSDAALRQDNAHINLQYLYRRASFVGGEELPSRMHEHLRAQGGLTTLRDIRTFLIEGGWPATAAEALIWDGHLGFDRTQLLTPQTSLQERAQ